MGLVSSRSTLCRICLLEGSTEEHSVPRSVRLAILGPPCYPFFGWEGSRSKIDYRKKGTLILTSLSTGGPRIGAIGNVDPVSINLIGGCPWV